ncbi:ReoY family proteolytic degradation factor [Enterococcus asini]|uniref:ReoY family proteolytic degradation factor n=1 Tax=Enterococcus asini TaxID=57732 RepID=UPI0028918DDE|nr:ReoY family proteolytic degradation factor [Enterococcus asini]MDT2756759.1 ReoY family proteolytic degradation factor [Enterococcus asini]
MDVDVREKKSFLDWLIQNVTFNRREVSWILNYLANHEAILANVHFVEHAEATKRGIVIRDLSVVGEALTLYLEGKSFTDSDQIFHEIRLNWKEPMYIECFFANSWEHPSYLSILEDNPYLTWNESIDQEILTAIDDYLAAEERQAQVQKLYQQIDEALEKGDKETFFHLSQEVNEVLGEPQKKTVE